MTNRYGSKWTNWHPAAKWTRHLGCVYIPRIYTHTQPPDCHRHDHVPINCTRWRYNQLVTKRVLFNEVEQYGIGWHIMKKQEKGACKIGWCDECKRQCCKNHGTCVLAHKPRLL